MKNKLLSIITLTILFSFTLIYAYKNKSKCCDLKEKCCIENSTCCK